MNKDTNQSLHSSANAASDHVCINLYTLPESNNIVYDAYLDKYPFRKWTLENDVYWYNFRNHIGDFFFVPQMWEDVHSAEYKEYWFNMNEAEKESLIASWKKSPVIQHENAFMFWPNPIPSRKMPSPCMHDYGIYITEEDEDYYAASAYYENISKIQEEYIRPCDLQVFLIFSWGSSLTTLHEDIMYNKLSKRNCVTKEIYIPAYPVSEQRRIESLKERFPNAIILSEWEDWLHTQKINLLTLFSNQDTFLPLLMKAIDEQKRDCLRTHK